MKNNILIIVLLLFFSSCSKDYLEAPTQSYITEDQLKKSETGYLGILRGIYSNLRTLGVSGYGRHEDYGHKSIISVLDLMGNDMVMNNPTWNRFYYDYSAIENTDSRAHMPWSAYYKQISNTNSIINNISEDNAKLKGIKGQALALRGFLHFMLARIYGPTYIGNLTSPCIPINTGKLYNKRKNVQEVYTRIISDLQKSLKLLEGYSRSNNEEIDLSVANAFIAKVYLETGEYKKAAYHASKAKENYPLLSKDEWLNGFYDINQNETMWGADINGELTTFVANFFSHFDNNNSGYAAGGNIAIDKRLYDAISDTDYRKTAFQGGKKGFFKGDKKEYPAYTSYKFRDLTTSKTEGDYIYLRVSEMYYIEAESLARIGNEEKAKEVLFSITSKRDEKYSKSNKTGNDLIEEILLQKRIEMWGEGVAWFDLKRLKRPLIRIYENSNHAPFAKFNIPANDQRFIFEIPKKEIDSNPIF